MDSYPATRWLAEARCVHHYEGSWHEIGYYKGVATYAGGFQFTLDTWNSAGTPYPSLRSVAAASVAEQMRRAYIVWKRGHTWRNDWPTTARICGTS